MLRSGTVIRLHELYASGKSIREIARITGHSRNTVRKYLRANGIPEPRYGNPYTVRERPAGAQVV